MAVRFSLDTNILVYAIDNSEEDKRLVATKVLMRAAREKQPLSLQALNEFCAVVKKRRLSSPSALNTAIRLHRESFLIVAPNEDDLLEALRACDDHRLPFWDALLWATVRRSGSTILLSEDLQHGRELGGVRFFNPFLLSARELKLLIG